MRQILLAAALLVGACHGGAGPAAAGGTTTTGSAATAGPPKLPDGPPLVTPGEHMSYKLALKGVDLATFDVNVGQVEAYAGKQAVSVQSHAKTIGFVKMLANVDDTFTSTIDAQTGRPLRWVSDEYATKSEDKERSEAKFDEQQGDVLPVTFHMNNDEPKAEPQKVTTPEAWDFNSFLVALRAWEQPAGSSVTTEILRSRYLWHVVMTIHGKETLQTALGALPTLRFDGVAYKLGRDGSRDPGSDQREFSIWISDDDGRVPLKIVAKTDYGDMNMVITDYQPGAGQRIRQ